jgi:DNA-binding response OmpR family regulator/archaellum biogenesis ATPase FlaH
MPVYWAFLLDQRTLSADLPSGPSSLAHPQRHKGTFILIKSTGSFGIRLLDERLSGPVESGTHVLIGGAGTGKTVATLQFLREGIRQGGRAAMLTQARPEDVIKLAHSIGIDLTTHLRSGRWSLISYQSGFRDRYRRTIEPVNVFDELETFVCQQGEPDRLAIDTCSPLVEARGSGNGAELLAEMLSGLRSTALLTFAAESPASLDHAFDFVSQRAALILHLTMGANGRRQFVVRKTLGPHEAAGPISFDIANGIGIVPAGLEHRERSSDVGPEVRRRILMVDVTGELTEEVRLWFEGSYEFLYTSDAVDAFPELARRDFGLVVVHVDRRSVDRGLHVMAQLRRAASRPPILVLCPYDLRARDRALALRTGADDFISGGFHPDELASRVEALLRRGRIPNDGDEDVDIAAVAQPEVCPDLKVLDLVRERLQTPGAPIFSLVLLRPGNGHGIDELAEHVTGRMRRRTGDLLSVNDDRVEVLLDGAMAKHAERFLTRVRTDDWTKIAAVVYTAPTDREELLRIIEPDD